MKWIKITAVFMFLLLVVNVFLVYNLSVQYKNTTLIDSESIGITILLLEKAGIYISESLIPNKKPDYKIFEGAFFNNLEDYYINTAIQLSGNTVTDDFTLHMINNGIKIIEKTKGEVFEFFNDNIFSFKYTPDGRPSSGLYAHIKTGDDIIYDVERDDKDNKIHREIEYLINKKFFGDFIETYKKSLEDGYMQVRVKKIYYNEDQNVYIADCIQTLNGLEIYSCEAVCVIYEGEMIYAEGDIIFSRIGNSYYTELYDQISVLFDEKAYIEQQRHGPITEDSTSEYIVQNITDLKSIYCISWNANRSKYYLIPSWYIEYNGNIARIRNAVNGNIYTI